MPKAAKSRALTTRPTENAKKLAEHAEAIRTLRKNAIGSIIEIGKRLLAAKELAGTGNWLSWLKDEFDWTDRTARNYMQVARSERVSADLKLPVASLYQITAPSTPPAVREAVAKKAKTDKVTRKEVAQHIRDAKPVSETKASGLQWKGSKDENGDEPTARDQSRISGVSPTQRPRRCCDL